MRVTARPVLDNGGKRDITIRIVVQGAPRGCHFALQKGKNEPREAVDEKTFSGRPLAFEVSITAKLSRSSAQADFGGPFVQGPASERFIYLASPGRRAKVRLDGISWELVLAATDAGRPLVGVFEGTAKDGGAFCASVHPVEPWHLG
jgi:hypothetical protein